MYRDQLGTFLVGQVRLSQIGASALFIQAFTATTQYVPTTPATFMGSSMSKRTRGGRRPHPWR